MTSFLGGLMIEIGFGSQTFELIATGCFYTQISPEVALTKDKSTTEIKELYYHLFGRNPQCSRGRDRRKQEG